MSTVTLYLQLNTESALLLSALLYILLGFGLSSQIIICIKDNTCIIKNYQNPKPDYLLQYIYFLNHIKAMVICIYFSFYFSQAHYINGSFTMPCPSSLLSMQYVYRCPRNSLEWDVREDLFNCSSINHTCGTANMFLYHCVLNADGTQLLEVCAPYKYIHGKIKFIQSTILRF